MKFSVPITRAPHPDVSLACLVRSGSFEFSSFYSLATPKGRGRAICETTEALLRVGDGKLYFWGHALFQGREEPQVPVFRGKVELHTFPKGV
jgi:hypothetical protein